MGPYSNLRFMAIIGELLKGSAKLELVNQYLLCKFIFVQFLAISVQF